MDVRTQAELDKAIADKVPQIDLRGNGAFVVTACDSSQVRAYGSSQVRAYDSSQVRAYGSSQVRAYDSSQVRAYGSSQVTACDSSQVRAYGSSQVTACDSSQVRAYGSSQVRAYDSSQVRATRFVAVTKHGPYVKIDGGVVIEIPKLKTASDWCEFYGVDVEGGVATLYKGLNDDFTSPHGCSYKPGTTPVANDWDGGKAECGGGLHFSPRPMMALAYHAEAKRFCACPVAIADIAIHPDAQMPDKVKARGCCAPVWECDIDGNAINSGAAAGE